MASIKEELVNELHKPARKKFKRRKVVIKGLNDLWQADLVEMIPYARQNRGYRYILVIINTFSKFVWAEPIKRKSAEEVSKVFKKIVKSVRTPPKNLQTDMGKEFFNREFKKIMENYGINHYSTYSNMKASIVERVNRTLKNAMWKRFSLQGNYKWLNILQSIVSEYNNIIHNTTGLKPTQINKRNEQNILKTVYGYVEKRNYKKTPKFKKNDYVRISKHREAFSKGYTPNWSTEIFQIKTVVNSNPITYLLVDQNEEEIQGGFYEEELQKVKYPDVYLVEKVIKKKGNKIFVKWLGLNTKFNSWIMKNSVL